MSSDNTINISKRDNNFNDEALDNFKPLFIKNLKKNDNSSNEDEEVSNDIFFEFDKDSYLFYSKSTRLRLLGISEEQSVKGIPIKEIIPNDYEDLVNSLSTIKAENDIVTKEYQLTNLVNETFLFQIRVKGIFESNSIIGYKGVISNANTGDALKRLLKRYRSMVKCLFVDSTEAIAITNINGEILYINKQFSKLFGYMDHETIGVNIADMIVPDEFKSEIEQNRETISKSPIFKKETIRKNKVGNKLYVLLSIVPVICNNSCDELIITYRDITREHRLNILQKILYNISSSAMTLPNINEFYALICKEFNDLWLTDNFFIAIYDKEKETVSLPYFVDEKDAFEVVPIRQTLTGWVIINKKPILLKKEDMMNLEKYDLVKLVGSPCEVWMGVPLEINGNILGIICLQDYYDENRFTEDDLTLLDYISKHIAISLDRRFMLDNLNKAKNLAEEAAVAKQSFLSTMSHEIRTPINEVIGIANILQEENNRPELEDYLRTLVFSSNHLLALVNDVLDYNKIDAGKIVLEKISYNMSEYLHVLERAYTIRANTKGLSFKLVKEGDIPTFVIGDQVRLNQVISNLFSNALKFTKEGGITLVVKEIERRHEETTLEFSVQDTGIGIEPDKLELIFEDFTQASSSTTRQYGGTGLGLAICKKLVELFGSEIKVQSEVGKGSCFSFTIKFPISEYQSENEISDALSYLLKGKRILLAEDNKINSLVAGRILTKWGVEVSFAENGKVAMEKAEKNNYDIILMDLHMPIMDGIEATRAIRNSDNLKLKNTPIIALSAVTESDCQEEVKNVRFDDFVLKPFKPDNLFNAISKFIL